MKTKIKILILLIIIFFILFLFYFFDNKKDNKNIKKIEIKEQKDSYKKNNDIVGHLKIKNTRIDIDIVKTINNEYYLNHNLDKNKDELGTPFMDYRIDLNNTKKIIIYGHNAHKKNPPFKELEKYYNKNYYKNHKYIDLYYNKQNHKYEIFSVYIETSDWDYTKIKFSDIEYLSHLQKLRSKSMYNTKVNIDGINNNILILQTCSYLEKYNNYKNKYLLIIAIER